MSRRSCLEWDMIVELETARLLLKPLELADAEQIQALFPQWEIVRYLTKAVPWPYPPDGALTFLRDAALPAARAFYQPKRRNVWLVV